MASVGALVLRGAVLALVAATSRRALANGKFPFADQVLVDPSTPAHVVVRTSFGLVVTDDAGATWGWVCEPAMGYVDYEPGVALLGSGAVVLGLQAGVTVGAPDACSWAVAPEIDAYAPDVSGVRGAPDVAVAITSLGGANPVAKVWRSTDAGASWGELGTDLPADLLGTTLDVAPSAHSTVYVSGLAGPAGQLTGVLARSIDDGETWTSFPIAGSDAFEPPYIGAIDPVDPDVVYVRLAGLPGRLLVTKTGGASFEEVFVGNGLLQAFALSPDGSSVLVGGTKDGIWRAPRATLAFEKVGTTAARCLAWADEGVYACGDDFLDGFFVGLSKDEGATFEPLLQKACLEGRIACDAGTPVGSTCPGAWPAVADQLDTIPCTLGSGASSSGAGGASSGAGGGVTTGGPGVGSGAAAGAPGSPPPGSSDDCACRAGRPAPDEARPWWILAAAVSAIRALRPRTRGHRRTLRPCGRRTTRRYTRS